MAGIHSSVTAIVAVFVLAILTPAGFAQNTCVSKLIPCQNDLNNTKPSDACCSALKDAVQNELACLCSVFKSGILNAFHINVTQALQLAVNCGITSDTSLCSKIGAPSHSPPASPGNTVNYGLGMLGMLGFVFWWSLAAYDGNFL